MFYYLYSILGAEVAWLNLFRYQTFRAMGKERSFRKLRAISVKGKGVN